MCARLAKELTRAKDMLSNTRLYLCGKCITSPFHPQIKLGKPISRLRSARGDDDSGEMQAPDQAGVDRAIAHMEMLMTTEDLTLVALVGLAD